MVNVLHKSVLLVVLSWVAIVLPSGDVSAKNGEVAMSGHAAMFIENKGQITDQYYKYRGDIDFKLPAMSGLNIFIGAGHMHYMWGSKIQQNSTEEEQSTSKIATYRLDVFLEGANTGVQPQAMNSAGYYERYYKPGLDGIVANSYYKVVYKNIYDKIDWVLYVKDGGLKYDFIVHPGGNVDDIQLRYEGAESMNMEADGLNVITPFGSIHEDAPYTYQAYSNIPVESSYKLNGNTMSFEVGEYNGKLVIDPSLEWASYMGAGGEDFSYGIVADTTRDIYIVGLTGSSTSANVASNQSFQDTLTGNNDGFIVKYSPGGARQWGTYYGGLGNDAINAMVINSDNHLVFCGFTDTSTTLYTKNAHQDHHGGGDADCFMGKIKPDGSILWATYFGGEGEDKYTGQDFQVDVKVDPNDNIYLVGTTDSDTGIVQGSSVMQSTRAADKDGFIAKFNTNGVRQWGTYYGGTYEDAFTNVAIDSNSGMVYVVGEFKSDTLGTAGTYAQYRLSKYNSNTQPRDADIMVVKVNPNDGSRIWATYYGGNDNNTVTGGQFTGVDNSRGIAVGDTGMVYFSGSTNNTTDIATSGTAQFSAGGAYDAMLVKLDSNGQRVWGTYLGGSGTDLGGNVVIDHKDRPNISGRTYNSTGIATYDGHQTSNGGQNDAFMVIYNHDGSKFWGTYYGGSGQDFGYSMATAGLGHMYLCGNSESTTKIANGGYQNTKSSVNDAFLAKFTPDTIAFIFQPFTQVVHCQKDSFELKYGVTEPFRTGNVFTVQLSDASGGFTNPVDIGSKQSITEGTINCGIPANAQGSGYRIRIVSSVPRDTSENNGVDILIKPLPIPPIATNNGPVCSNDTLILSTKNSGTGVDYSWTGPSFSPSSTQDTFVTRTTMNSSHSGDYYVAADLNGCVLMDTTSVVIKQAADKPIIQSNDPLCTGDDLIMQISNYSSGPTIKWEGPNGWTDTAAQQTSRNNVVLSNAGDYIGILWQNGCDSRDTTTISISQRPSAVTASSNGPICTNDELQLTTTNSTPSGVQYSWSGPGGYSTTPSTTGQNATRNSLQTSHSGNYVVTVDLNGCQIYDTVNVTINQAPNKPQASSNSPLCSGDDLELTSTNISGGAVVEWRHIGSSWSATGANTTRQNIQVAHAGDYYVESNFTSNGCSAYDTVSVSVTLSQPVTTNMKVLPGSTVCPTADLVFTVDPKPASGSEFTWYGPGSWGAGPTPDLDTQRRNNAVYSDSGWYKVRIVSSACAVGVDSVYVNVVDTISPPDITLPNTACAGDTLQLNITHPYLNSFTVFYPDGTNTSGAVITENGLSKNKHEGRYVVRVSSGGCTAYDTGFINTIKPQPAKPNSPVVPPICEGETLELKTGSSTSGVSYEWYGPSGFTATSQNPSIPNTVPDFNAGIYVVRAILNGCYSTADSVEAIIDANPKPVISVDYPEVCEGGEITLSLANSVATETYEWYMLNGSFTTSGTEATFSDVKLSEAGSFIVAATSGVTGCIGGDTVDIAVVPQPNKPTAIYNSPLCQDDRLELDVEEDQSDVSYVWRGPAGFTFVDKKAFKNDAQSVDEGTYIVTVTRQGDHVSCSDTSSVDVVVKPRPEEPDITSNSPIAAGENLLLELLNPTPGASFVWKGPNGFGSRLEDPILNTVSPEASGSYTLTTTLDGCSHSAVTIVLVSNAEAQQEELILFPNPNKGSFTVKAEVIEDQIMPFEVVSVLGNVVYQDIVQTQDKKMEVEIEVEDGLTSGVYIFRVMMSGQSREVPFTIVR